jgi:hypothetical protein
MFRAGSATISATLVASLADGDDFHPYGLGEAFPFLVGCPSRHALPFGERKAEAVAER